MDSLSRHTDYGSVALDEDSVAEDPQVQFGSWLVDAEAEEIYEPNAMVLSTVDDRGRPSSRTVLLKGLDAHGFTFVTNYRSAKGLALSGNPEVSLLFPWYPLQRQVIVRGTSTFASAGVSDALFAARPRASQIASMASEQSRPIDSRKALEEAVTSLARDLDGVDPIPRPQWWGAVHVRPYSVEFWQGRTSRMHDRLLYSRASRGLWTVERLQP